MKFKIRISQHIAKILLKERSLNQITVWEDIFKLTSFFLSKNIEVFRSLLI